VNVFSSLLTLYDEESFLKSVLATASTISPVELDLSVLDSLKLMMKNINLYIIALHDNPYILFWGFNVIIRISVNRLYS
jgi:hypothetical protein